MTDYEDRDIDVDGDKTSVEDWQVHYGRLARRVHGCANALAEQLTEGEYGPEWGFRLMHMATRIVAAERQVEMIVDGMPQQPLVIAGELQVPSIGGGGMMLDTPPSTGWHESDDDGNPRDDIAVNRGLVRDPQ